MILSSKGKKKKKANKTNEQLRCLSPFSPIPTIFSKAYSKTHSILGFSQF